MKGGAGSGAGTRRGRSSDPKPDKIVPVQIVLNGQTRLLEPGTTLAGLVASLELGGRRMAVEINEEVIPRSGYADLVLGDGDRVEIVHAVGGG